MTTNEIIKELKNFPTNSKLDLKILLNEAANKLSQLQQLIDDQTNDHYVDTLDFYADRCHKLEEDFASSECLVIQIKEAYEQIQRLSVEKSETIKEFAERLKELSTIDDLSLDGRYYVYVDEIDNLVKEWKEQNK